jgi:hypothetical protein
VRCTYDLNTGAVSADQEAFIEKLLEQYTMTNCNPSVLPMTVDADLTSTPLSDVPDKDIVAADVKLVGEMLYISINTMSEIMYALCSLTRFMTRVISWVDDKSSRRSTLCNVCVETTQRFHGNQLSLLSSLSLQVRLSSSVWFPALKK